MANEKIRAIIFDIGRVLVRLDIAEAMKGLAGKISLSPEETWSAIEHDPSWRDWQEGRMAPRDWQLHICRRLGVTEVTFYRWRKRFAGMGVKNRALIFQLQKKA